LRLADSDASNYVALQAPATVTSNVTLTLPGDDGDSGQVLSTDGAGALSWATAAAPSLDDAYNNFGATASKITIDASESQTGGLEFELSATNNPDMIIDMQGTGDFIVQDAGTALATFADDGSIAFVPTSTYGVDATGAITIDSDAASTLSGSGVIVSADTGSTVAVNLGGAAGDDLIVDTTTLVVESDNNRVGIGTATPASTLHITPATAAAFQIDPFGAVAGNTGEERFLELAANGANYVGFKAADALAGDVIWTLPIADGTASQVLSTDGGGALSWTTISSGSVIDADADTKVDVEESADEDIIRFDIGDAEGKAYADILLIGGDTTGGFVWNDAGAGTGAGTDFRLESDLAANMFFMDASANKIGIGAASPAAQLEVEVPDTFNTPALMLDMDDTTNNPNVLVVDNAGTGNGAFIDQNGDGLALNIDSEATTAGIVAVDGTPLTTGTALSISALDALTTGAGISIASNSADTSTRSLVSVVNDNTAATGTTLMSLQQDASSAAYVTLTDGTDTFGLYNNAGTPEAVITADTGSITVDTTNAKLYMKTDDGDNTDWRVIGHDLDQFTFTIYADGDWNDELVPVWNVSNDGNIVITQVNATVIGSGTPTLTYNIEERTWGSLGSAGTDIFTDQTAAAGGTETTTLTNAEIDAEDHLVFTTGTTAESGTVSLITVTVYYYRK
jgi:hypothetical protein